MSGFILAKTSKDNISGFESARRAFSNKSYTLVKHEIDLREYTLVYYDDFLKNNEKIYQNEAGDVFYYSGYFSYGGKTGAEALRALEKSLAKGVKLEHLSFHGNFVLICFYQGLLQITRDLFGGYGCYTDKGKSWFTSNFVSATCMNKTNSFRQFGLFESILFNMEFGLETLVEGIELLDPSQIHQPCTGKALQRKIKIPPLENSYKKCLESNAETLLEEFRLYHHFFGNKITSALTGGFDSRLMLAAELHESIEPDLYTNGSDEDVDVKVAKNICFHENLKLFHAKKNGEKELSPAAARDVILQNFWDLDGTNQVFTSMFEVDSRMARAKDHLLVLNGAGGEIYRDVWKWDFKRKTLYELIKNSYDTGELKLFGIDEKLFFEHIEHRVSNQLEHFGDYKNTIDRQAAEMIFPVYRSNFYFQGNNVNNYFGNATLPYMSQPVVLQSLSIPYHFKRSGRFEADLIKMINPKLAAYASEYGFSFKDGPSFKSIFKEWGYAQLGPTVKTKIKAALGSSKKSIFKKFKFNNTYLAPDIIANLIDKEKLWINPVIADLSIIRNQNILNRIYSLELMASNILN